MAVYLDYNASCAADARVLEMIAEIMAEFGNASSGHSFGRKRRSLIERARADIIAHLGGGEGWEVVFCGGATVANNLILRSFERRFGSASEHASITAIPDTVLLPVDKQGHIDEQALSDVLQTASKPFLVSVQGANSETGILQDVPKIASMVQKYGGILHSDMVQWLGKLPFSLEASGLSAISLSGHKFGAPAGIGALLYRRDIALKPLIYGGGQEQGLHSGTENTAMIVGLATACGLLGERVKKMPAVKKLRDDMEKTLQAECPDIEIVGQKVDRLPNTSCLILPNSSADSLVVAMDLAGFAVSAGSACSFGRLQKPSALTAMGWTEEQAGSALRVSLGIENSAQEVQAFTRSYLDFIAGTRHAA